MTAPTLEIAGEDQLPFVHNRTMSVKRNTMDVTLIAPSTVPLLGDGVVMTNPTWAGTVTNVESTTYDDGTTFYRVTATNADALPDNGAGAFNLDDGPPANYSDLVVTRTLNNGVTEIRAKLRTLTEGLEAGDEVDLTSAAEGFTAETFTIRDLTTTWPTADGPVYELDLGLGDFATSSTGGGDGGALDPPSLVGTPTTPGTITRIIHESTTNVRRGITDTFDRPNSLTPGTSDAGIEWVVSSGAAGITGNRLEVASGGDANLTYDPLTLPFAGRFELKAGGSMDGSLIIIGNVSLDFDLDTGNTYDVSVDVVGAGSGTDTFSTTITPGVWYIVRVESVAGVTGRAKIWPKLSSEPGAWDAEATNATGATTPDFAGFLNGGSSSIYIDNLDIDGVSECCSDGSNLPRGTSFPGSPSTNDPFFRTDLGMLFYYDGTRWLSVHTGQLQIGPTDAVIPYSVSRASRAAAPIIVGSDIWLVSHQTWFFVQSGGSALSGSHKWVGTLLTVAGTIDTITIDSGSSGAHRQTSVTAIGALMGSGAFTFVVDWVKTGTPGSLSTITHVLYRHVAT